MFMRYWWKMLNLIILVSALILAALKISLIMFSNMETDTRVWIQ